MMIWKCPNRIFVGLATATSVFAFTACTGGPRHFQSCYSDAVKTGEYIVGTCDLAGYLIASGGTVLVMEEYDPKMARECLESGCPSISFAIESVKRVPYPECVPTKVQGVADFKYVQDIYDGSPVGFALIKSIDPEMSSETVACEFPVGFYMEDEK